MTRLLLVLLFLAAPVAAQAPSEQVTYPAALTAFVSDHADVLDAETEARLTELLVAAREDPGAEITVVTLGSRSDYGPHPSLERFATGLFNDWGIGDATRNNGILILVAVNDREMRIELGTGHPRTWDLTAEEIVHRIMLPAFRAGELPRGIEEGTAAAIDRIARPFAAGLAPPEPDRLAWLRDRGPVALFVAGLAAIFGLAGLSAWRGRHPPCPQCGSRRTALERRTTIPATRETPGTSEETITCRACREKTSRILPVAWGSTSRRDTGSSSSGFGGGSSSGGGASGRW